MKKKIPYRPRSVARSSFPADL